MNVNDKFIKRLVKAELVYYNVSQTIVITTEDKLKLAIQSHSNGIDRKKEWIAPFSICLSIIISMSSSNFIDFFFSSEAWHTIFLIFLAGSAVWFFWVIRFAFTKSSDETLLEEICSGNSTQQNLERDQTEE